MNELITVVELPSFLKEVGTTITDLERDILVLFLAQYPERGDEIPRTGGLRKLRWQSEGKGKRAGLRVIYFFYNRSAPVFLLTVYKKGEQENLTHDQEKKLAHIARELKKVLKENSGGLRWLKSNWVKH